MYVLQRYDLRMIRAIPALRVTSNHAYVISLYDVYMARRNSR